MSFSETRLRRDMSLLCSDKLGMTLGAQSITMDVRYLCFQVLLAILVT